MAESTSSNERGWVIELGAGTGAVTQALLARGIAEERIVLIERSAPLVELLRQRFPGLRVVCGDACELQRLVHQVIPDAGRFEVVSSLPLRSLPPEVVRAVMREIGVLLRPGGRWVQFTYAIGRREVPAGFSRLASSVVWGNIPPARVDVYSSAQAEPPPA